jgi:hypothetical protein
LTDAHTVLIPKPVIPSATITPATIQDMYAAFDLPNLTSVSDKYRERRVVFRILKKDEWSDSVVKDAIG